MIHWTKIDKILHKLSKWPVRVGPACVYGSVYVRVWIWIISCPHLAFTF